MLEIYDKIRDKVSKVSKAVKKGFNSNHLHNENHLKTRIKCCEGKVNTNFQNNKMPKEGSNCICLSMILKNVNILLKKKRND